MTLHQDTPSRIAWLPWSLAFLVSLLAHLGLFTLNPNLLMGQGAIRPVQRRVPPPATKLDEIQVREIRRVLPRLLDAIPELTPQDPVAPSALEQPTLGEALPAALQPAIPAPELTIANLPLPEQAPDLEEPPSDWQPREEVLALTAERLQDRLDFLPRVLAAEEAPPSVGAPDIRLPSNDPPPAPGKVSFAPPPAPPAFASVVGAAPFGPVGVPDLQPFMPGDTGFAEPPTTPQSEQLVPSLPPEQVTGMQPVEGLLRMDTRVFTDPNPPGYRYFKIQILRAGIESLPVLPRDIVFLIDASASMTQEKVDAAVQGVRSALDTLTAEDRFNIIVFRERVERMAPEGVPGDLVRRANARAYLSNLRSFGRTDVFASLEALRSPPPEEGRPRIALLITDGVPTQGVTGTSEILEGFSRENQGLISVFGIGAGRRVNRLLLDFLGFRNRGDTQVVDRNAELPGALLAVAEQVARPVLIDLSHRFSGGDNLEVYPTRLTHLYLDRPLVLVGRAPARRDRIAFQMIGTSRSGRHDLVFEIDLANATPGPAALRQEWAWQAVLDRIARHITQPSPESAAFIRRFAAEYGLQLPAAYTLE